MSLPATAPQGMAKAMRAVASVAPAVPAKKPYIQQDKTVEDALHSVASIIGSPRTAAECRARIAEGADIEFRVIVRAHHEPARGFCVSIDKVMFQPVHIAWRTDLK